MTGPIATPKPSKPRCHARYGSLLALLVLLLFAAPALAQFMHDPVLSQVGIDQRLNEQVPLDLTFRDEMGKSVQLRQYFGKKPVILTLVYYECPMLCTLVLNGLVKTLGEISLEMGKDFDVVTVSINPRETPELARQKKDSYVARYPRPGAAQGWHFLTGEQNHIHQLAYAAGFRYAYDDKTAQYAHAAGIMLLTPRGRLARYFYGLEYSPRDVRLGLVEASGNRIGSRVDQVLLYCYHYDPKKGKYGLVVMNIIRAAGAATILALGSFMFVMFRRDRRRRSPKVKSYE